MPPRYIRAAEVGSFTFCRRAWFLERQHQPTDLAEAPEAGARRAGRGPAARKSPSTARLSLLLLVLGIAGIAWVATDQDGNKTALLFASTVFVALGVLVRVAAKSQGGAFDLSGEILYTYAGRSTVDLLVSDRCHLIGRPDFVLEEHGERIPVERKDRMLTHSGPHESERLQLGAYCLLLEERERRPVHRGRLQYQNTGLDITFDEALRRNLLATLAAIQVSADLADVRRSHPSPARCRGCAFRMQCTESLALRSTPNP